ncbi:MAG: class I SAM-dependent methyltransferase [Desulfobaccales bacterium]
MTEWRQKALGLESDKPHITAQRNAAVLRTAQKMGTVSHFLDIGCGTGELVLALAAKGVYALGLDFAPEMIELCRQQKQVHGIKKADFLQGDFFNYQGALGSFDLVSALGFIEYISKIELHRLLEKCRSFLHPEGRLVISSRNRLFNLCSFNEFTQMELKLGTTDFLLKEAVVLVSAMNRAQAIEASCAHGQSYPQPESHPETSNVKVKTRHQYTPGELGRLLREHSFEPLAYSPIHYHAVPPAAKSDYRDLYLLSAHLLHEAGPEDYRLLPFCSSFVVEAKLNES